MQEIVKLVVEKTGISEDLAAKAVEVVQGYLQYKMPGGLGDQVKAVLGDALRIADAAQSIAGAGQAIESLELEQGVEQRSVRLQGVGSLPQPGLGRRAGCERDAGRLPARSWIDRHERRANPGHRPRCRAAVAR